MSDATKQPQHHAPIAQGLERCSYKANVAGSNPAGRTILQRNKLWHLTKIPQKLTKRKLLLETESLPKAKILVPMAAIKDIKRSTEDKEKVSLHP